MQCKYSNCDIKINPENKCEKPLLDIGQLNVK